MSDADGNMEELIAAAVRYGVRVEANQRLRLLDDAALAEAYRYHLSGLKINCVARHYGVRAGYLSEAFSRKGWPTRNYNCKAVRAAALAGDGQPSGQTCQDSGDNHE